MGVAAHLGIRLSEYDAVIRTLIPHYENLIGAAAEAVRVISPVSPVVIDLGTGSGALARQIMRVRPKARVTGIDEDAGMLAVAKRRLAGGAFTTLVGNFERMPISRCDVVSASFALHHIRTPQRKLALYQRAHRSLRRGGILVSADCFLSSDLILQRADRASWIRHLRERYSPGKAEAFLRAWAKEDVYFTLEQEIEWLERTGFRVDTVLRRDCFATLIARK